MKIKRSIGSSSTDKIILHPTCFRHQSRAGFLIVSVSVVFIVHVASFAAEQSANVRNDNTIGPIKATEIASKSQHNQLTMKTVAACKEAMQYNLMEEGTTSTGAPFTKYAAYCGGKSVFVQDWIDTMTIVNDAAVSLTEIIQKSKYGAVYFETKGCTASNVQTKHFEFVLVDAPELKSFAESSPDAKAFEQHFTKKAGAVAFLNWSGSSKLIAPTPPPSGCGTGSSCVAYTHLTAFCRQAPPILVTQVWQLAALEYKERLMMKQGDDEPVVWFSTSGTGVAWLHFRLDYKPKYYTGTKVLLFLALSLGFVLHIF